MSDRNTADLRSRIARALEPAIERETGAAGPHPSVDELVRYHGGELDEGAAERVQGHVTVCAECLETLLDLESFVAAGVGPEPAETEVVPWRPAAVAGGRRVVLALAASLLVAVSALAVWVVRERSVVEDLRHQVAALSAPRPDVPIVEPFAESSVRREPGAQPPVALPSDQEYFTFVLSLPRAAEYERFEAELVDAGGRVSWSGPLTRSRFGTFTLGLGRGSLSPGENRFLLYGVTGAGEPGGRRSLLETYSFRVESPKEVN